MTESQRLASKGIQLLKSQGWPDEAIEEIVTTLMGAGMAHYMEQQLAQAQRNEVLIQKAMAN